MIPAQSLLSPPHDSSATLDAILVQLEPSLVALTQRIANLSEWEREEITQLVHTKLARTLPGKEIHNERAYLQRAVRNESISFHRLRQQRQRLYPLVTNDDGEPYQGKVIIPLSQGMGDPQVEFEQQVTFTERLEQVVAAILRLPPVQKRAMICSLRDHIGDPDLLTEAFKKRGLDITAIQWPTDRAAKQRLQASCHPARQRLAQLMDIDLTQYAPRRGPACVRRKE
jgi:DNA-directed RNA polymerase specialized sigma24 family protein